VAAALLLALVAGACDGSPARIVVGVADTVVVNSRRPTPLPARVLDADGRALDAATAVRFRRTGGAPVPVSASGIVTCTEPGDAVVRATLGALATDVVVRCRPVHVLHAPRRLQVVLGEAAPRLVLEALGPDSLPVAPLAGVATIDDSTVATLDGLTIRPRSPGATTVRVRVGDHATEASVEVYEPAPTLDGLAATRRLVAVPLRLASGEMRRWRIPAGSYLVAILPDRAAGPTPRVAFVGVNCAPMPAFGADQYSCLAGSRAAVMVLGAALEEADAERTGHLALRRLGDLKPGDAAALRE
jgi:hypothetical protein